MITVFTTICATYVYGTDNSNLDSLHVLVYVVLTVLVNKFFVNQYGIGSTCIAGRNRNILYETIRNTTLIVLFIQYLV